MSQTGSQIIFKQLLDRHSQVQIPMIQRDFAQGRPSEQEVRVDFLNALHAAFELPAGHSLLPLNLDFIYGSAVVNAQGASCFAPLDGQQRLTTLFLLHWYLALKDDCAVQFRKLFCVQGSSKFSYNVRPSSKEFFDALVNFFPDISLQTIPSLIGLITDQPWYFRNWRLDPTIQSALIMLDAIHARFKDSTASFERLIDERDPVISFQLLDLEHYGLSDDLYIKMNARGKPLTAFETFKARYEHLLNELFKNETRALGGRTLSIAEYFMLNMDTRWADFFWTFRDRQTHLFDTAVMNLMQVVALISRDEGAEGWAEDFAILKGKELRFSFSTFQGHGWLDRRFSETLFLLLERWSVQGEFRLQLPDSRHYDERKMFTTAISEPASLDYTDIVQLFGYVEFLRQPGDVDAQAFQEWMRIVCNLSVNTAYERPADVQRSIAALRAMLAHSAIILKHFAEQAPSTSGFREAQVKEEVLKAQLILAHHDWRALIDRAEKHGYFKGQIAFLLDFCGVRQSAEDAAIGQWVATDHADFQQRFELYLRYAEVMFNERGLDSIEDARWERALLSLGDYLLPSSDRNWSFLVNSAVERGSWKRLLRSSHDGRRELLKQLWDRLDIDQPLAGQLDRIVADAKDIEPWRQACIETPAAFDYGRQRALRWEGDDIYLLKKSRMSGAHAELYGYALRHRLGAVWEQGGFAPLILNGYASVSGSEYLPCICLESTIRNRVVNFTVAFFASKFWIGFLNSEMTRLTDLKELLIERMDFRKSGKEWEVGAEREEIEQRLRDLADLLKEYTGA